MAKKYIKYLVCGVLAFAFGFLGVFGSLDCAMEDVLYHKPQEISDEIRIIKIDDKTLNELGDYGKWERSVYADLIEKLCVSDDVQPAVIGFDILFSGNKTLESDGKFVEASKKYGNVVCAFSYVFEKDVVVDAEGNAYVDSMIVDEEVRPYEELEQVTKQGFVNGLMDSGDGVIRSVLMYYDEVDGTRTRNFGSAVYEAYMQKSGQEVNYPTEEQIMTFRYSGGVSEYEAVSLVDVLNGNVPAEAFDDCIVLVGAYAQGMMDSYYVPVDRGQQMYGVEIHANVIQALMQEKVITAIPAWVNGLVAAIISILLMYVCEKLTIIKSVIGTLGVVVAKLVVDGLLFNAGYSSEHLTVIVFAIVILAGYIVNHYYKARVAKQRVEKAFSKYVAPQVIKEISKNDSYEIRLGGENRDVAVLFVDIRGFTTLSESVEPEQVVTILNRYLGMTTQCIFDNGGTLDKFIGDATMAVFNAPFDLEDYVFRAVKTAWDIVQHGDAIKKEFLDKYNKEIGFGVGVNCGPAVVGNIGCDFRMDYTAIGDTVNTAARLESNAPTGTVYISQSVYDQVKDRIEVEEVGQIPLKGKSIGVMVYSVKGIKEA